MTVVGGEAALDVVDVLYDARLASDKLESVFSCLFDNLKKDNVQMIDWKYLVQESMSFGLLEKFAANGTIDVEQVAVNTNVTIKPGCSGYADYFASLSKHTRQNVRTAYNRIEKDGMALSLRIQQDAKDKEVLAQYLQVMLKRHRERYGSSRVAHRWFVRHGNYVSGSVMTDT